TAVGEAANGRPTPYGWHTTGPPALMPAATSAAPAGYPSALASHAGPHRYERRSTPSASSASVCFVRPIEPSHAFVALPDAATNSSADNAGASATTWLPPIWRSRASGRTPAPPTLLITNRTV